MILNPQNHYSSVGVSEARHSIGDHSRDVVIRVSWGATTRGLRTRARVLFAIKNCSLEVVGFASGFQPSKQGRNRCTSGVGSIHHDSINLS